MKVALIQAPVWGTREPPLSLVQLSGLLKSKGFEARSFDFNNFFYKNVADNFKDLWAWENSFFWHNFDSVETFFRENETLFHSLVSRIIHYDPDIVGFSVASSSLYATCVIANCIKKINKNILIIFGGQGFYEYDYAKSAFSLAPVDYIVKGEGEIPLIDLIKHINGQKEISQCRGIYHIYNGSVTFTGEVLKKTDLNKLPYMDYSDLKIVDYDDAEHISIMASRGCVWSCAFCSSRSFNSGYKWMSGERIHQEICYQRSLNPSIGHIDFSDLVFNGNMKRVRDFCNLMNEYPPYDAEFKIQWVANAIITPELDADTLLLMKEAGCQRLIFGIESGAPKVLEKMKKNYAPEVALEVIKNAHKAGIMVTANFMFGFPGESEEDFKLTLEFIKKAGKYIERVYPSRTYCALEQGSRLYENPMSFGIKTPVNHHLYWESCDGKNNYPARLQRCRRFEKLCRSLGVNIDGGVQTEVEQESLNSLRMYYEFKNDNQKAAFYYDKYLKEKNKRIK